MNSIYTWFDNPLLREEAIEAGGITIGRTGSAKDYGPLLERAGVVPLGPGEPIRAGDVVVMQQLRPGHAGHMAMYDGTQWISDFRQDHFYPGPEYRTIRPRYTMYRKR